MDLAREPFRRILRIVPPAAGALAVIVGGCVAAGWFLNVPTLRSMFPGLPEMKLNAAIAFVLAGIAVRLLSPLVYRW